MPFPKIANCLLAGVIASFALSAAAQTSEAQDYGFVAATYKVQVEYWFFDTDNYYWSTVLETNNPNEAKFLYQILLTAKEDGTLNQVAAHSYWRYIAVDVRLIRQYARPRYQAIEPLPIQRVGQIGY